MRLLILDQFSDPGGAQQALLEVLPAVRERGWDALVGMPGDGPLFDQIGALGFETAPVECGPYRSGRKSPMDALRFLSGAPRLARQVRQLAKQIQADLVYVNGPRLLPAAALAGLRLPVVFHSHSYIGAGLSRRMAGEALRRTDASVIAACRFVAEPWTRFVPRERVTVIYNGVAGPARGFERRSPPRIGCIGRIAPEKGQREFLRAASIIHRALPECRFVVCGAPLFSEARAQRYAARVRVEAADLPVEFTGWISDINAAMAGLDLLLVPSTGPEATTRVIPEAYAAGVPVIAFPSGGIPEVAAGLPGMLADSVEQMAALAIELLTGPEERLARMSEAAREQWRARFTLERYRQEVLATIECAARGSAARELTNA